MIIVTGSVQARPESRAEVLRLSLEHWVDRDTLDTHFRVPASRAFAKSLGALAAVPPTLEIYDATPLAF